MATDLPSGRSVTVIIKKGQETFLNQSFTSVVKTLEKLPSETAFPVKLNFTPSPDTCASLSSSTYTVDASIASLASKVTNKHAFKTTLNPQPPNQAERFDLIRWDEFKVKAMLAIVKEKKNLLDVDVKNCEHVWQEIADELAASLRLNITGNQCYNKYKELPSTTTSAASITSHITDSQATGATITPPSPGNQSELADFIGWDDFKVKAMLAIVKEKKHLLDVKNKKPVWQKIADKLSASLKVNVTGSQCYNKFRKLKQSLQKYEDEKKKTRNGTPKPFKFTDLYDIVGDDPTLQPFCICASDGSNFISASTASTTSIDDEILDGLPEPPRKRQQKTRSRSSMVVSEVREIC